MRWRCSIHQYLKTTTAWTFTRFSPQHRSCLICVLHDLMCSLDQVSDRVTSDGPCSLCSAAVCLLFDDAFFTDFSSTNFSVTSPFNLSALYLKSSSVAPVLALVFPTFLLCPPSSSHLLAFISYSSAVSESLHEKVHTARMASAVNEEPGSGQCAHSTSGSCHNFLGYDDRSS